MIKQRHGLQIRMGWLTKWGPLPSLAQGLDSFGPPSSGGRHSQLYLTTLIFGGYFMTHLLTVPPNCCALSLDERIRNMIKCHITRMEQVMPLLRNCYGLSLWLDPPKKVMGTEPSPGPGTEGPDVVGRTPYLPYVF